MGSFLADFWTVVLEMHSQHFYFLRCQVSPFAQPSSAMFLHLLTVTSALALGRCPALPVSVQTCTLPSIIHALTSTISYGLMFASYEFDSNANEIYCSNIDSELTSFEFLMGEYRENPCAILMALTKHNSFLLFCCLCASSVTRAYREAGIHVVTHQCTCTDITHNLPAVMLLVHFIVEVDNIF